MRRFALLMGVFFLIWGVLSMIPGLLSPIAALDPDLSFQLIYGFLFGVFPVNLVLSLAYLGFGIWGVYSSVSSLAARTFSRSVGIVFLVFTVMGFFPLTKVAFTVMPLYAGDIALHAIIAVLGLFFGFFALEHQTQTAQASPQG